LESCKEWLCQGDLFANAPILQAQSTLLEPKPLIFYGVSLLVTHDCQLDKRNTRGDAQINWVQFAPVRPMSDLRADQKVKNDLRDGRLIFPEAVFIEGSHIDEDCVVLLSEMYSLPASYLGIEMREFAAQADEDPLRAVATRNAERICTMSEEERKLLRAKMIMFWTRLKPAS
jgi:hypothetical protein